MVTYASWNLGRRKGNTRHPLHGGTPMSATVESVSIDEFCRARGLDRVDLIKIDTDGHEMAILEGARRTVKKVRPAIVFEVGEYLIAEKAISFLTYCDYFSKYGYHLFDAGSGSPVTRDNWKDHIPMRSTTDIVALP